MMSGTWLHSNPTLARRLLRSAVKQRLLLRRQLCKLLPYKLQRAAAARHRRSFHTTAPCPKEASASEHKRSIFKAVSADLGVWPGAKNIAPFRCTVVERLKTGKVELGVRHAEGGVGCRGRHGAHRCAAIGCRKDKRGGDLCWVDVVY